MGNKIGHKEEPMIVNNHRVIVLQGYMGVIEVSRRSVSLQPAPYYAVCLKQFVQHGPGDPTIYTPTYTLTF